MQTEKRLIESGWRFKEAFPRGGTSASDLDWMPAQVPGHVHLDLQRAGVIDDPFYRLNERGVAWVDETDWVYETTFTTQEVPACAYLRFNGLDTIADILLNGENLGQTDNMFIAHEFAVGGRLRAGENTLRVVFSSALRVGRERQNAWDASGEDTLPRHEWFSWGPRSFVRKAQYMYGWDWGPELVSCGLWQSVELLTVPTARLLDWKHTAEFDGETKAVVHLTAEIERAPGQEATPLTLTARLTAPDGTDASPIRQKVEVPTGSGTVRVSCTLEIDEPVLWSPNGVQTTHVLEAALYGLEMTLHHAEQTLDSAQGTVGIRTVELVREPDADGKGESFKFRVNGSDLFIKGANWIPAHSFPTRTDDLESLIVSAAEAGFNMLRVWGGGLYETERFYALCDQYGILVWQDFPYGCAYYPDTGVYADAARHEATHAVRRLRKHASLALLCGNNENQAMHHDGWTGKDNLPPRFLGEHLYDTILPEVVAAEAPAIPYWPGSPYGGDVPQSDDYGDKHNWNVWHGQGDWHHYLEDNARFLSEFGFASSCGMAAWDGCLADTDKTPRSPAVRWHDKTRKGYETYLGYVQIHYPAPQTLEDLVYYTQCNQADALKCGIEHWRRKKGRCWGTLFWQINDCWPVQSWAVIDSELDPKAAYYACKRFYAPVLLSLVRSTENPDLLEAHLTSDLQEHIQGDVILNVESLDGEVLRSATTEAYLEANGTTRVAEFDLTAFKAHGRDVYVYAQFVPTWELNLPMPVENFFFLAEPKDLRLASPQIEVAVTEDETRESGWFVVQLTAKRFAPSVWLRLWNQQGGFSDNFFSLRAGETKRVLLGEVIGGESLQGLSAEAVRAALTIRSL